MGKIYYAEGTFDYFSSEEWFIGIVAIRFLYTQETGDALLKESEFDTCRVMNKSYNLFDEFFEAIIFFFRINGQLPCVGDSFVAKDGKCYKVVNRYIRNWSVDFELQSGGYLM
ncbi:hypothetical protein [Larkinella arboricola]